MGIKDKKKQEEREQEVQQFATNQLVKIQKVEVQLSSLQKELSSNPAFAQFLVMQKELDKQTKAFWDDVKEKMIENGVKKIDGKKAVFDWGWITIGETISYQVTDETKVPEQFKYRDVDMDKILADIDNLPEKYFSEFVDLKEIKDNVKLTNKVPKGVKKKIDYKLMKKINLPNSKIS